MNNLLSQAEVFERLLHEAGSASVIRDSKLQEIKFENTKKMF
jgi:hypothetical protein